MFEAPFHFFHGFVRSFFRNGAGENVAGDAAKTFLQTFEEVVRDDVAVTIFVLSARQNEDLLVREVGGDVLTKLFSTNFLIPDFFVDGTGVTAVQRHGPNTHGDCDHTKRDGDGLAPSRTFLVVGVTNPHHNTGHDGTNNGDHLHNLFLLVFK